MFNPQKTCVFFDLRYKPVANAAELAKGTKRRKAWGFGLNDFSSQSTGLARTISVGTEVALVKLVNVLADG